MKVTDYQGQNTTTPGPKLQPSVFQEDKGSDRFHRKAWRRRRGMRHTDVAKQTSTIVGLLGFQLSSGEYATVLVSGAEVHGFAGVGEE